MDSVLIPAAAGSWPLIFTLIAGAALLTVVGVVALLMGRREQR